MASVTGATKLIAQLGNLARKAAGVSRVSVAVGYTADYALTVHEDLTAFHRVGQAKYLEEPFRNRKWELNEIVRKAMLSGKSVEEALLIAGLQLQRWSQELVPVDTGALKNSAFTRKE